MEYTNFVCSVCDSQVSVLRSSETDVHLRQCQNCNRWFILREDTDAAATSTDVFEEITTLANPPQCPVDNCREQLSADTLAEHVVKKHDSSLNA